MKILIILGSAFVLGINFVLYCCFIVASREDEYLEKIDVRAAREKDEESSGNGGVS